MPHLHTYSTDQVPARQRLAFWHHITQSALNPQTTEPVDRTPFSGRMSYLDLEDIRVVELSASGSRVSYQARVPPPSCAPCFLVRMAIAGEISSTQGGRETLLQPGDFTLCDTSSPYQLSFREVADVLVMRIERNRLLQYIGRPDKLLGVPMRGDHGLTGMVSRQLRDIWTSSQDFIDVGASVRMAELTMQLLASAYAAIPQSEADGAFVPVGRRAQVVDYIERHLRQPTLSPVTIAAALYVTPAYLHKIFSRDTETLSRFILRRRLQESAKLLRDPVNAKRTVTDVALSLGFNSLPHFCRVFKEMYGVSASDFRER